MLIAGLVLSGCPTRRKSSLSCFKFLSTSELDVYVNTIFLQYIQTRKTPKEWIDRVGISRYVMVEATKTP